jgi:predicted ATPase
MGIQELEIRGFRSLRNVRWTPGRLNVLIGPNGSGKSNLLDACALLQEAAQGKFAQGIMRRGGIAPLLWDGKEKSITWNLTVEQKEKPALGYLLEARQLGTTSSYSIELERLAEGNTAYIDRTAGAAAISDPEHGHVAYPDSISDSQTLLSLLAGPFGNPTARTFQRMVESWGIYHDLRVDSESSIRQAPVTSFEKRVAPDGQNLVAVLHTLYTGDREFKRSVDAAMYAAFGADYEGLAIAPAADQRVQLRVNWRSLKTPQSAANLSDGTLRFLLLVAILANPDPGDLIAIDEPDTGLHPGMLPLVAELASEAARRTQVIFTTHSPLFLDAFREEPPTTTVAQWVDGETRLEVVDDKELKRWLAVYSLGDVFRSGELEGMV